MRRKLLFSGLAIAASAAALVGGVSAEFTDTEITPVQSVRAGTLDLVLDGSAISNPIDLTDRQPGDRAYGKWVAGIGNLPSVPAGQADSQIHFRNTGTLDGVLQVFLVKDSDTDNGYTEPELLAEPSVASDTDGELDDNLFLQLDGFAPIGDDLAALSVDEKVLVATANLAAGAEGWHRIFWEIPESVGNEIQSDGVSFHFEYVLTQAPRA
jgi:hypothetical protein